MAKGQVKYVKCFGKLPDISMDVEMMLSVS